MWAIGSPLGLAEEPTESEPTIERILSMIRSGRVFALSEVDSYYNSIDEESCELREHTCVQMMFYSTGKADIEGR